MAIGRKHECYTLFLRLPKASKHILHGLTFRIPLGSQTLSEMADENGPSLATHFHCNALVKIDLPNRFRRVI